MDSDDFAECILGIVQLLSVRFGPVALAHIQMCCTLARSAAVVQQALALVAEGEVGLANGSIGESSVVRSSCSGWIGQ